MLAVAEAAGGSQRFDVVEGLAQAIAGVPELQLAHPRRVDDQPASGEWNQLTVRGRMTPLRVRGPDITRPSRLAAHQAIDDRRLADARGTDERTGHALRQ